MVREHPNLRSRNRQGVVLLIAMACIVIGGVAMVGVTRQSLRSAVDSIDAERELQHRWGVISTQYSLLKGASTLFDRLDKQARLAGRDAPYPSTIRSYVMLGGVRFDAVLSDENAKLDVNYAYHSGGKPRAGQLVTKLNRVAGLTVRLMPEVPSANRITSRPTGAVAPTGADTDGDEDDETPPPPPAFRHWGEVFDLARSNSMGLGAKLLPTATRQITCWGRGQLNIHRATDPVIEETCRLVVGPGVAQRLIRDYRENPLRSIRRIALDMEVGEQEAIELARRLGNQSNSFSLWLTVTSPYGKEHWFAVRAPIAEGSVYTERFRF